MSNLKTQYNKSKYKFKRWESAFKKLNNRNPTKNDIKEAPPKIRGYYKQYWYLKVKLLEETYFDHENETIENNVEDTSNLSILGSNSSLLNSSNESDKQICAQKTLDFELKDKEVHTSNNDVSVTGLNDKKADAINKKSLKVKLKNKENEEKKEIQSVWGEHLNKIIEEEKKVEPVLITLQPEVSKKLFAGSSFKKRNPRKSFCKSKSNLADKSLTEGKSFLCEDNTSQYDVPDISTNFTVEDDCSPNIKALIGTNVSLSPFLFNKKIITEVSDTLQSQPVSALQTSFTSSLNKLKSARKLDVGWLERVNKANELVWTPSSDSGYDSNGSLNITQAVSVERLSANTEQEVVSDDDFDIIDSDTESMDVKSIFSQKRKSFAEQPPAPAHTNQNTNDDIVENPPKRLKLENKASLQTNGDVFKFSEEEEETKPKETKTKRGKLNKKEMLEKKIASGTLNDNFVRINIKKKVHVRGKKNFNFSKFKKQQWKNKWKQKGNGEEAGSFAKCYKCQEIGHYAKNCQSSDANKMFGTNEEAESDDDCDVMTLEEAEILSKDAVESKLRKTLTLPLENNSIALQEIFNENFDEMDESEPQETYTVLPIYDRSVEQATPEVFKVLQMFGHSNFRPGQEAAIMRILSGQSTLVTLSTGTGKSLCYQLPAYMYAQTTKCLTLVVSPLVSLMEDQVAGSLSFFKVACLHYNMNEKQRELVVSQATSGALHALLVSPETIVAGEKLAGFKGFLKKLPPIAFACIDEAHCLSQWSHNFRPSYLLICQVLRDKLGIKTVLGLTATATKPTIQSISSHLGIDGVKDVITDIPLPNNLILSVSRDANKDQALLNLLQTSPFRESKFTLIYCTRRDECERLAILIRTALKDFAKPEKLAYKRLSWNAESYHAGMSAAKRKQVQKAFMSGNLRIVVATVAFGMGINKPDIRAVIHFNMPKNFESYVQEVGRAGRDGRTAYCHLFLDSRGKDLNELRRFIYADSVDRFVLRKLLQRVFVSCSCKPRDKETNSVDYCPGHEVAFDSSDTIQTLDLPEENILTLLCYLELHPKKWIEVLSPTYTICKIFSYKGAKTLKLLARECPPLAMALALNPKTAGSSELCFKVVELANKMNWESGTVKRYLKNLEWKKDKEEKWKKTGVKVEFSVLGFHLRARGNMSATELDEALETLVTRVTKQEKAMISQLDVVFNTLQAVSYPSFRDIEDAKERSEKLKTEVRQYFDKDEVLECSPSVDLMIDDFNEEEVIPDIRTLICTYRDVNFNGRAIARIFHGIQSPNYPASTWYKCRYWRGHMDKNFNKLSKVAAREILRYK